MKNKITLKDGRLTAVVDLDRGASCISLRDSRYDARILREPDGGYGENPFLYGIPLLYPQNRIEGGRFEFEGREYVFPINETRTGCHLHGDIHCSPFTLEEQTEDSVTAYHERSPREGFPHGYRITQSYRLEGGALRHTVEITNLSDMNMPSFFGLHTTFALPFCAGSSPEDVRLHCELGDEIERDMSVYLPTGRILPPDEFTEDVCRGRLIPAHHAFSRHYKASGGGSISLTDTRRGVRLCYEADESLPFRLIYNGGSRDLICLEPLSSAANCQNSPLPRDYTGFGYIEPHGTIKYSLKIYLTEEKI